MHEFYSNGKLLLSGEYVILDGAVGLALPTAFGQSLKVMEHDRSIIRWKSLSVDSSVWFEAELNLNSLEINHSSNKQIAKTLQKLLRRAKAQEQAFLNSAQGYVVETRLGFDRNWGLGSSSTLINNIAQWAQVDPYELLWNAFSGSGYDIASAQCNSPILYYLDNGRPVFEKLDFNPSFKDNLFFIHLNKKQNSREGIAQYRKQSFDKPALVKGISELTRQLASATSLLEFETLLTAHERLLAEKLKLPAVKSEKFPDFPGAIKSLGAWGGDFILATGTTATPKYFKEKGYDTVIPYSKMIL